MDKSPFLMGKSTISMVIFNSYVSHYQRVYPINIPLNHYKIPLNHYKIPLNHHKIPLNHYNIPLNHYRIPLNHHNIPLNLCTFYQSRFAPGRPFISGGQFLDHNRLPSERCFLFGLFWWMFFIGGDHGTMNSHPDAYPPVNIQQTIENDHRNSGFTH